MRVASLFLTSTCTRTLTNTTKLTARAQRHPRTTTAPSSHATSKTIMLPKVNTPAMAICNRCIVHFDEDDEPECLLRGAGAAQATACDIQTGIFKKKCQRWTDGRHPCIPVEQPLFLYLNTVIAACTERERLRLLADDEAGQDATLDAHRAVNELKEHLATFNVNRSQVTGDQVTPRKRDAGAPPSVTSEQMLLETQRIRPAACARSWRLGGP
ncbi:hypothetical protein LTR53_001395 [Teratosphaeriaceae sp. CCFEE 6253]|nr:hypothetical protein LTR53_001395 [Teratosphaeriaceae sp. CCFEE 6253]